MHLCQGNWVVIGRAVVYYARAVHTFSAETKCPHCMYASGVNEWVDVFSNGMFCCQFTDNRYNLEKWVKQGIYEKGQNLEVFT